MRVFQDRTWQLPPVVSRAAGLRPARAAGRIPSSGQQVAQHFRGHVQQHQAREDFEVAGIRQQIDADERSGEHAGQGAQSHHQGQGPEQAAFAPIAPNPGGAGQHVEKLVGGADAGVDVAQHAHLERQKQKRAGNAAHGGEKGNTQCHGKRNKGGAFNTGGGKIHGRLPWGWACESRRGRHCSGWAGGSAGRPEVTIWCISSWAKC